MVSIMNNQCLYVACSRCGKILKELTDEEIVNLYKETEADNGGIREFARAILRKAQTK